MKKVFSVLFIALVSISAFSQKQKFDVINYAMPKGWDKIVSENGLQLSTKDDGTGSYAAAIILRAVATDASANDNFSNSWNKLVKGSVTVSGEITMLPPESEKGWSVVSGQANYTDGANKGVVTLITATGNGKMTNVVIMTNTDKYQNQLLGFINSLDLNETITARNNDANSAEKPKESVYSITVPPTWNLSAGGNSLTLEKNTIEGKRVIEFMNMVNSSGSLEKDMEHIFFEVFDGWNLHGGPNNLLFDKGDHQKGLTCQGLPYYMLSNSITKGGSGNGDVIKATVLLIQVGSNVAVINSADKILGSETDMALNFLLFNLKINGVAENNVEYKKKLTGTWGASSGLYGNSSSYVTNYTAEGKYYVLAQSTHTVGYGYYYDLIKSRQFKNEGVFSLKGNVLERKGSSGSATKYFIRFYSSKYGNNEWGDLMGLYEYSYDKSKIEPVFPFRKI
ncbi:MAG: hypothetical protein JST68_30930 [Bacteroidetes bacterium]|nr:hypothetical protein [Bacteroidota bacterium]